MIHVWENSIGWGGVKSIIFADGYGNDAAISIGSNKVFLDILVLKMVIFTRKVIIN